MTSTGRGSDLAGVMPDGAVKDPNDTVSQAIELMESALAKLDEVGGGLAGALLDNAIHEARKLLTPT